MNTRERLLLALLVIAVLGLALLFYEGRLTVVYQGQTAAWGSPAPTAEDESQSRRAMRAAVEEEVRRAVEARDARQSNEQKDMRRAVAEEVQKAVEQDIRATVNAAVDKKLRRLLRARGIDSSALRKVDQKALVRLQKMKQANKDALVAGAVRIASDARAWKMKPEQFGGGSAQDDFANLTFAKIGYSAEDEHHSTIHGAYSLVARDDGHLSVRAVNEKFGNEVVVTLAGLKPGQMKTDVRNLKQ